jgi:hypothetical protein
LGKCVYVDLGASCTPSKGKSLVDGDASAKP